MQKNLFVRKLYIFNYAWWFFKKQYNKKKFISRFLFQEALLDFIWSFFGYLYSFLFIYKTFDSSNVLGRLLIWIRRLEWFKVISYEKLNTIHYYIEPFERLLEWDIFFRDTGPYLDQGYLNSYRYKLKTVRDEPWYTNLQ